MTQQSFPKVGDLVLTHCAYHTPSGYLPVGSLGVIVSIESKFNLEDIVFHAAETVCITVNFAEAKSFVPFKTTYKDWLFETEMGEFNWLFEVVCRPIVDNTLNTDGNT